MIIVPPDVLSAEDVKKLEANDICVVVASDPAKVRFMDPIPAVSSRTEMEQAAIRLSRILLHGQHNAGGHISRSDIASLYVNILVEGTPLGARGSLEEQEKEWAAIARRQEVERLAREETHAAREAKKKAAQQQQAGTWKPGGPGRPPKHAAQSSEAAKA